MKHTSVIALVTCSLTLGGCASVMKGTDQPVTFTSKPSGAEVVIDGQSRGVTPLTLSLKKNKHDVVMVRKDGYRTETMPLTKQYDGVALLNVFWDFSTTDVATGAAFEYVPNGYYFDLQEEE